MSRSTVLLAALLVASPLPARDILIEDGDVAGFIAAVHAANQSPGPDRVFLPAGSEFVFEAPAAGEEGALPVLRDRLDIIGNGAVIRRYSHAPFRHVAVADGAEVRLVDLVFADGGAGAVLNRGDILAWGVTIEDSSAASGAAALLNFGSARLVDCDIRFNSLSAADPTGGAVVNHGFLEITGSRLLGNTAFGGAGQAEFGAALSNFGEARVVRTLIAANGTEATFGRSGAVANFGEGKLVLEDSTLVSNEPTALAGVRSPGAIELSGTRIAR